MTLTIHRNDTIHTTNPPEQKEPITNDEDPDPFLQQMNRGEYLRQLRLLALQDEMERLSEEETKCGNDDNVLPSTTLDCTTKEEDEVQIINGTGQRILQYNVYLAHQRYYDDLKHIDMHYINYGSFTKNLKLSRVKSSNDVRNMKAISSTSIIGPNTTVAQSSNAELIIQQDKSLGKGGFCWDAAFILGEHVLSHHVDWMGSGSNSCSSATRVLELGAGTGLCGLMIAQATDANVTITDLPELLPLMEGNLRRNFPESESERVQARTLRWGCQEDYHGAPYDVILGADIVASLYDPVALAATLYALSGSDTKIYISSKSRLDKPHEEFDLEMKRLFGKVERVEAESRLKNPDVFVMVIEGKREGF